MVVLFYYVLLCFVLKLIHGLTMSVACLELTM